MKSNIVVTIIFVATIILLIIATIYIAIIYRSEQCYLCDSTVCSFTIESHYGDFIVTGNQSFSINKHPKLTLYFPENQENMYWFEEEPKP